MSATAAAPSPGKEVKKHGGLLIVLGIVTVILGVLAMGAPLMAGVAVNLMVGAFILVGGIARLIFAFKATSWRAGIFGVLIGIVAILVGILMLTRPLLGLASLTLFLAAYFFADGILEIVAAFKHKPEKGWGWVLVGGIAALLLGIMIWRQWPLSGAWAIGILFGINLIFSGMSMIALGSAARAVGSELE
jgi:uncharacterized membrane protein HdeD (DUF308 family)